MALPEDDKSPDITGDVAPIETGGEPGTVHADVVQIALDTKKAVLLDRIATLLASDAVIDQIDRGTIGAAVEFIKNPTENLADIQLHTTRIGEVQAGYMMQGEEAPAEIDALAGYLFSLQCINRINFVEGEIARGAPNSPEVQQAMVLARDWAITLSNGYQDGTQLRAVNELCDRLKTLTGGDEF